MKSTQAIGIGIYESHSLIYLDLRRRRPESVCTEPFWNAIKRSTVKHDAIPFSPSHLSTRTRATFTPTGIQETNSRSRIL